jgi:glycosyltransferase involved in cell wall biosynthesis
LYLLNKDTSISRSDKYHYADQHVYHNILKHILKTRATNILGHSICLDDGEISFDWKKDCYYTMNIAHIGNTAGVAFTIASEQQKNGHKIDIFVFDDGTHKQFGGIGINYNSRWEKWRFHQKLQGYDVWHYHYPYGSLKEKLESKKTGKIFLKHYHGDDLRGKHEKEFCVVSTPDLLKYAPKGVWIPNPINFKEILNIKQKPSSKIPKIAHYPYYNVMKSFTDYHSVALTKLENHGACNVIKIVNVPHKESLELISTCDIVIGKILPDVGWFGKFELEGMALGKPVIAYVSDELYNKFKPPIFRTTPDTIENDISSLLADMDERERLSKEGLKYVKDNHDASKVTKLIQDCYEKLVKQ